MRLPTYETTLLPCPFCAGSYVRKDCAPYTSVPVLERLADDAGSGWRVSCYGCCVQTWNGLTKEEAIGTWNRRIAAPPGVKMKLDLSQAIENAARDLPEGFVISVRVENGAGWVEMHRNGYRAAHELSPDFTLAEQVAELVRMAKAAPSAGESKA